MCFCRFLEKRKKYHNNQSFTWTSKSFCTSKSFLSSSFMYCLWWQAASSKRRWICATGRGHSDNYMPKNLSIRRWQALFSDYGFLQYAFADPNFSESCPIWISFWISEAADSDSFCRKVLWDGSGNGSLNGINPSNLVFHQILNKYNANEYGPAVYFCFFFKFIRQTGELWVSIRVQRSSHRDFFRFSNRVFMLAKPKTPQLFSIKILYQILPGPIYQFMEYQPRLDEAGHDTNNNCEIFVVPFQRVYDEMCPILVYGQWCKKIWIRIFQVALWTCRIKKNVWSIQGHRFGRRQGFYGWGQNGMTWILNGYSTIVTENNVWLYQFEIEHFFLRELARFLRSRPTRDGKTKFFRIKSQDSRFQP